MEVNHWRLVSLITVSLHAMPGLSHWTSPRRHLQRYFRSILPLWQWVSTYLFNLNYTLNKHSRDWQHFYLRILTICLTLLINNFWCFELMKYCNQLLLSAKHYTYSTTFPTLSANQWIYSLFDFEWRNDYIISKSLYNTTISQLFISQLSDAASNKSII